jgi:hypothetical protein
MHTITTMDPHIKMDTHIKKADITITQDIIMARLPAITSHSCWPSRSIPVLLP